MTSYKDQVSKYERIPEGGNPAQTEAWAMIETAKRLATAILHGADDDFETRKKRKDALRLNWRLWTIIQAELTQTRPDLPPDLQVNMLTLCNFIDKHTVGALLDPTAEKLSVLIDINRNIATGLMQMPEDAAKAAAKESQRTLEKPTPGEPHQRIDAKV